MSAQHVDVVIVGAGLSGIGAACHLQRECPGKTYAILDGREAIGGTWDLFRYPGIRSDSDMYTMGYSFKPWKNPKAIADGPDILSYVRETAREHDVERNIRFDHQVVSAEWSSEEERWTVEAERRGGGEAGAGSRVAITCDFLFGCTGYYRYDEGYKPEFAGTERFPGPIVHPQHWPADLEYEGKRVVVIGSGATAVTLVPAMAGTAEHVTMLQRSPSYIISLPAEDPIAKLARRLLPPKAAYSFLRWKNVIVQGLFFQLSRRRPGVVKKALRRLNKRALPPGYDIDKHFKPSYNPWDQRLCLVPDGDLFEAISDGTATVVTDQIESFTEKGLALASGEELEADVVVTATGLDLVPFGGAELAIDGARVEVPEKLAYKGMMLEDVPNFAVAFGYTNASWTLKCDLTCEYVCRVLNHMDAHGYRTCTPRNHDSSVLPEPFVDFNSGYVLRAIDKFPKQGSKAPWRLHQNYPRDIALIRRGELEDGALEFSGAVAQVEPPRRLAA